MAVSEIIERFSKTSATVRGAGLAAVVVVFGGVYYFMFYSELVEVDNKLSKQIGVLKKEKASYEDKKRKYMGFRAEVGNLLTERKELMKVLPTRAQIPMFLQLIHSQAELSGLNIIRFAQGGEINRGFYAAIPVHMSITGTYHQIQKFFYSVGKLKRIVNIQNVALTRPRMSPGGMVLDATFVASTFRFLEIKNPPPPPGRRG